MPRDGAGIYTQPFPDVAPDTTIESTVYNGFVADVVQDMNTPRPIIAGGTGATNAEEAMAALKGEIAAYAVTNFDSHIWFPGSFRAASTATGGPVAAHAFAGSVVINEPLAYPPTNQNVLIEAYDLDDTGTPPGRYIRQKKAGVWGGWMKDSAFSTTGGAVGAPFALADLFFGTRVAVVGPPATLNRFVWNDKADATGTDIATLSETGVPLLATDLVTKQYASPLDAMAFNGMQINGGFSISQELGIGGGLNGTGYFADQWYAFAAGTASLGTYVQNAAPFSGLPFYGISGVNPAQAVLAAGDCYGWSQFIEGYRTSRLAWGGGGVNAQPITIGFYCAHHRPGLYSVAVRNGANNRSYVATYTQNVADAAEYKTITVPGDSLGTWATTTAIGLTLTFTIASGATYTAAAPNVWTNGNFFAAPGQVNAVASTADSFKISGVTVLPGTHAPPAAYAMLLTRPDTEELFKCQRYYYKSPGILYSPVFVITSGNSCLASQDFAQALRVGPSMGLFGPATGNLIQVSTGNFTTTNISLGGDPGGFNATFAGGTISVTAGQAGWARWGFTAGSGFYASARF